MLDGRESRAGPFPHRAACSKRFPICRTPQQPAASKSATLHRLREIHSLALVRHSDVRKENQTGSRFGFPHSEEVLANTHRFLHLVISSFSLFSSGIHPWNLGWGLRRHDGIYHLPSSLCTRLLTSTSFIMEISDLGTRIHHENANEFLLRTATQT
jgi:hypothetical protein